jgi:hypothetical protein
MLRYLILTGLLLLAACPGRAQGLGDWSRTTPCNCGNRMADNGNGVELVVGSHYLSGIQSWYFYRGFIVGRYQGGYFLAQDKPAGRQLLRYAERTAWQQAIRARQLQPRFWTRWHHDNWQPLDSLPGLLVLNFPLTLLGSVLLAWLGYQAAKPTRVRPDRPYAARRPYQAALAVMGLVAVVGLFLGSYPYSF